MEVESTQNSRVLWEEYKKPWRQWLLNHVGSFCHHSDAQEVCSGGINMAHYTIQALCMHVVQCVWGPNKSTLPWKGLYQVEVVLSENWLGKGGLWWAAWLQKCRQLSLDASVLCPCVVGCCNCRIFRYLRKGRIKLITQEGLGLTTVKKFQIVFQKRHETRVLEKKNFMKFLKTVKVSKLLLIWRVKIASFGLHSFLLTM